MNFMESPSHFQRCRRGEKIDNFPPQVFERCCGRCRERDARAVYRAVLRLGPRRHCRAEQPHQLRLHRLRKSWGGLELRSGLSLADAQIIAVCDVDENHLNAAKAKVEAHYGGKLGKDYKGCATYGDFRELINRKDIDVVGIATPDHWHVIPAIMAAKAGKDVICEKPLTLTVAEGRLLCDVVKQAGRIFQTASENRSIDTYIRLIELVRGGVVGKLKHIEVRLPMGNTNMRVGGDGRDLFDMRDVEEPPKSLNYEMWLGQAPLMPYIPARAHGNFRWNLAFSGGVLTDWGAHMVDLAQWGHDTERTGPVIGRGQGRFSAARRRPQHRRRPSTSTTSMPTA